MGYMREKSVSNGKNALVFTVWPQRVGKKGIQASPKLFKQNHQRPYVLRKRYKSLAHSGQNGH